MSWSDSFSYPDGPLGAPWTVISGSPTIAGGEVTGEGYTALIGASDEPSEAHIHVTNIGVYGGGVGSVVKANAACTEAYAATFLGDYSQYHVRILKLSLGSWNIIHTDTVTGDPTAITSVGISYNSGVLTTFINGASVGTHNDADYSANTYVGIYAGSTVAHIDSFDSGSYTPPPVRTLTITPDPLWIGGGACLITATGSNTEWSDGSNPSTTFSADHGEVELYRWVSATEWELVYTPDDYLGTVTFSETQYGLEDTVTTTVIPPSSGGNGLCQLTPAGAELINDAAALYENSRVLTEDTVIVEAGPAPAVPMVTALREIWSNTKYDFANPTTGANVGLAIYKLWYALNAAQGDWPGPWGNIRSEPVAETLGFLLTLFLDEAETGYVRNRDILAAITSPDLSPILDAIGTSWFDPDYTLHDDLDYLDNRSDHSLDQIQTRLGNMWGTDHWSLSQIVGAAGDPQIESFASLHNIYARLQAMRGDTNSTIADAQAYATLANTNASAAHSAIDAVRTAENLTLQDILDRLDTITDQISALSFPTAPVWPGVEHATVYQPYNLTDGLTVQGPLHGLLFTITGQPAGAGRYKFGSHSSWTKTGAVIFTSDRGDHERAQQFGLDAHIVCPKEMSRAASATLRLNTGWTGTVRRFLVD